MKTRLFSPQRRHFQLLVAGLALGLVAACGAPPRQNTAEPVVLSQVSMTGPARFATGPINSACSKHTRSRAKARRCGCVQAAADITLTKAEQQRGARYFGDPEALQRMKLSDTPANERAWSSWAEFARTAETLCKGE